MPPGCGLTNQWTVWQSSADGGSAVSTALLTQTRGRVVGGTDGGFDVDGGVFFDMAAAGPNGYVFVTGDWRDGSASTGTFTWYPDVADGTFAGELSGDAGNNLGAWCGSLAGIQPSPCLQ